MKGQTNPATCNRCLTNPATCNRCLTNLATCNRCLTNPATCNRCLNRARASHHVVSYVLLYCRHTKSHFPENSYSLSNELFRTELNQREISVNVTVKVPSYVHSFCICNVYVSTCGRYFLNAPVLFCHITTGQIACHQI